MGREIRISIVNRQLRLEPLRDGKPVREYVPDLLENHLDELALVFESPATFQVVVTGLTGGSTSPTKGIFQLMRRLRICILKPMSTVALTEAEKKGMLSAPELTPVFSSWKKGFKAMARDHDIQEIIFDLSCNRSIDVADIGRSLQEIQTMMNEKAAQTVKCSIIGCSEDQRVQLGQQLAAV